MTDTWINNPFYCAWESRLNQLSLLLRMWQSPESIILATAHVTVTWINNYCYCACDSHLNQSYCACDSLTAFLFEFSSSVSEHWQFPKSLAEPFVRRTSDIRISDELLTAYCLGKMPHGDGHDQKQPMVDILKKIVSVWPLALVIVTAKTILMGNRLLYWLNAMIGSDAYNWILRIQKRHFC